MRTRRFLAILLLLPALALAQGKRETALPPATGRLLLAAVPARADLVVHTPDLPGLLATAEPDGLGDPQAWRRAFRAQLDAWGARTGAPELLVAGAEALLAAADGEVLVAGMRLPPVDGPARATLVAFRTSRRAAALRPAFDEMVEGGLVILYPGVPSDEEIGGRPVTALSDVHDRLYVLLQDGLVAAADHPLALGLLFRGLETAADDQPAGERLLEVRHGRGDASWTGWTFREREAVSWHSGTDGAVTAPLLEGLDPVAAVALPRAADAPLLPAPAPGWAVGLDGGGPGARLLAFTRAGGFAVSGARGAGEEAPAVPDDLPASRWDAPGAWAIVSPAEEAPTAARATAVAGGAARLGWLRGWASGRLAPPVPGIDRELLLGPLAAASRASEGREPFATWTAPEQPGELRGPRWHGPTTLLTLRTLADIVAKREPASASRSARPASAPQEQPPARTGGVELPPPVPPRKEADDAE